MTASTDFYRALTPFTRFSQLAEPSHYRRVPDDWWVVITDVKGSTEAIANNRYKDVNLLGASSIIAVMNTLKGQEVPFVFGGDGATLLIHESNIEKVRPALFGTLKLAREVMNLDLRIGLVPMRLLTEMGHTVEVAKFAISNKTSIATLRGGGLTHAEKLIKNPDDARYRLIPDETTVADVTSFEGLSCRWNPIQAKRGEMMSLLIVALDQASADEVYHRVILKIEKILDETESRPVTRAKLDTGVRLAPLVSEMHIQTIGQSFGAKMRRLFGIFFELAVMQIFMRTGYKNDRFDADLYIREMGENTDFQKFDDMIRMVRDCTLQQRGRLVAMLDDERANGQIAYGVHLSDAALMTCLVFQLDNHIHFVDGSNGGYALAAKQLKEQLKESALRKAP